jgi:hypothetical protein
MVSNQEEWVDRAMYQARRKYKPKTLVSKPKAHEHTGELGVVERIILKSILEN